MIIVGLSLDCPILRIYSFTSFQSILKWLFVPLINIYTDIWIVVYMIGFSNLICIWASSFEILSSIFLGFWA